MRFFLVSIILILAVTTSAAHAALSSGGLVKPAKGNKITTELGIYREAARIAKMGWGPETSYRMRRNGQVCSLKGSCYQLSPIGVAKRRAGGKHSDYYGSAVMTKMLMEYILGRKVKFRSGDRPNSKGSNRHNTSGASYAFDLVVSSSTKEKAKVAAAWKFAAQSFRLPQHGFAEGFQASLGMNYKNIPNMVHVDTKTRLSRKPAQYRYWDKKGPVSKVGRLIWTYYGRRADKKNKRMPYQVLVGALRGKVVTGAVDTGLFNGVQTSLLVPESPIQQPYQTRAAVQYRQAQTLPAQTTIYSEEHYSPVSYYGAYEPIPPLTYEDEEIILEPKANPWQIYFAKMFKNDAKKRLDTQTSFIVYPAYEERVIINASNIEYTVIDVPEKKWYRL